MIIIHEKEIDESVLIPKDEWVLILNILKKTDEVKIFSYEPPKKFTAVKIKTSGYKFNREEANER